MSTPIQGKRIAIVGRNTQLSDTELRRLITFAGGVVQDHTRDLDILCVGQLAVDNQMLKDVQRHNELGRLRLKGRPKLIEIWDDQRVGQEFSPGFTRLSGKRVLICDDTVARLLLVSLVQSRGGSVVQFAAPPAEPAPFDIVIIQDEQIAQRILDQHRGRAAGPIQVWGAARLVREFGPLPGFAPS